MAAQTQANDTFADVELLEKESDEKRVKKIFRLVQELREEARANGIEDMSMEEIDEIIGECRREWQESCAK